MDASEESLSNDPDHVKAREASGRELPDDVQDDTKSAIDQLKEEISACREELAEKVKLLYELESQNEADQGEQSFIGKELALDQMAIDVREAHETSTIGSWSLKIDTGEVSWSPELHKIFRQEASSPVPTIEQQRSWYTKESYEMMLDAVARTIDDGSRYNMELEIIRVDGTKGTVRSTGEAERDESGKVTRVNGIAQDITKIKQAETKLKLALEQEKAAQIYKDQFLANMSHEIRTPMNGVVGFVSLLRDDSLDPETKNEYIKVIESCSNQLLKLIDDILDVAKIEAGEIKIEKQAISLVNFTRGIAATLESARNDKGKHHINLVEKIPDGFEKLKICSDPYRVRQILTNLLTNSFKFSEKGTIEFGFEVNRETVDFFVKDDGIGIEPERIELIFKRFEHLEGTTSKYEGAGLGLSISKGLADLLGAKLSVESKLGVGSTFWLQLPLEISSADDQAKVSIQKESENKEVRPCTVLLIDDEKINQKLMQRMLRSGPYKIFTATNGEQAVQAYRDHPEIDLVLMDIRMPIMNGDEAARQILERDPEAKIIAQTAYALREEREELFEIGFVDYISKPYQAKEFLAVIEKWSA